MDIRKMAALAAGAAAFAAGIAQAQVPQYGPNVTLEQARKLIASGGAEARKNNWPVAIAVVDNAGMLVAFEKIDNTQNGSVMISQDKAVSAAMLRRPTKVIQDALAAGGAGLRFLGLRYASPVDGGLPIIVEGKVIGGIGVSGVTSEQDAMVATAGLAALK
jgi:glc operon protein GlcG